MKLKITVTVEAESTGDMKISGRGTSETMETRNLRAVPMIAEALAKACVIPIEDELIDA